MAFVVSLFVPFLSFFGATGGLCFAFFGTSLVSILTLLPLKIRNRIANSVDPDEMARYEQSYLDLHCLQTYAC